MQILFSQLMWNFLYFPSNRLKEMHPQCLIRKKIWKISYCGSRSQKYVEFGHFTSLFRRGRQKMYQRYNARAQLLHYSLNLSFSDVAVAVVVFFNFPMIPWHYLLRRWTFAWFTEIHGTIFYWRENSLSWSVSWRRYQALRAIYAVYRASNRFTARLWVHRGVTGALSQSKLF